MRISSSKDSSDGSSEEILEGNLLPKREDEDGRDGEQEDDDTCGLQCCGKSRLNFNFLEVFATPMVSLILISIVNVLQGFMNSGLFGATVSTLEKRFDFWSTDTGLIASCYNISSLVVVLGISYVGGKGHKPSWIAWGTILMGIASVLFSLPHFFAPAYTTDTPTQDGCNEVDDTGKCGTSTLQQYKYIFIASWLLCGAGGTPLSSLAVPYLDENVKQNKSSLYTGIYYATEVIGPALGYFFGSQLLSIYTNVTQSVDFDNTSPQWIGNWWIGFLVGGILTVVLSVPILCLPKHLPNTRHIRLNRDVEVHGANPDDDETTSIGKLGSVFREMLDVCRNPTYLLVVCAFAAEMALLSAFVVFGAKFFENVFQFSKESASVFFGALTVVGGALGSFAGGVVVTKAKLDVRGIFKFVISSSICSILATSCFFFYCPDKGFAGATVGYNGTEWTTPGVNNFTAECNSACRCSQEQYAPVCGSDDVTYYSYCFAGCQPDEMNSNGEVISFTNCSCIPYPATATPGVCPAGDGCSQTRAIFFVLCFIFTFCTFLMQSPALQAVLRVVPFSKRPLAVGIKFFIERVIGSIPGPIVFGAVLDRACTVWNVECGVTGSCAAYNNHDLAMGIFSLNLSMKLLAVCFFIAAVVVYKPPPAVDDDSGDDQGNLSSSQNSLQQQQQHDCEELQPIITNNVSSSLLENQEDGSNGIITQRV